MNLDPQILRDLDGRNVLIKPAHPEDPNSVALRGTVRVRELPGAPDRPQVELVVGYPEFSDMNGEPAHEEVIPLSPPDVAKLIAGELGTTKTYEFTLGEGHRTVRT